MRLLSAGAAEVNTAAIGGGRGSVQTPEAASHSLVGHRAPMAAVLRRRDRIGNNRGTTTAPTTGAMIGATEPTTGATTGPPCRPPEPLR